MEHENRRGDWVKNKSMVRSAGLLSLKLAFNKITQYICAIDKLYFWPAKAREINCHSYKEHDTKI